MAGVASRTRAYEDGVEKEAYERSLRSQWGGNMPTGIEQLDKAGRQIWFLRSMPRINTTNHEAWLRAFRADAEFDRRETVAFERICLAEVYAHIRASGTTQHHLGAVLVDEFVAALIAAGTKIATRLTHTEQTVSSYDLHIAADDKTDGVRLVAIGRRAKPPTYENEFINFGVVYMLQKVSETVNIHKTFTLEFDSVEVSHTDVNTAAVSSGSVHTTTVKATGVGGQVYNISDSHTRTQNFLLSVVKFVPGPHAHRHITAVVFDFPETSSFWSKRDISLVRAPNLHELPDFVVEFSDLRTLRLLDCGLRALPNWIDQLTRLTTLELKSCIYFTTIPDSIGGLAALEELNFTNTRIAQLPESIGRLGQLERLILSDCPYLTTLPDSISGLTRLRKLDLSGAGIVRLPASLRQLTQLKILDLSRCDVEERRQWQQWMPTATVFL